jgi:hypothetical protein
MRALRDSVPICELPSPGTEPNNDSYRKTYGFETFLTTARNGSAAPAIDYAKTLSQPISVEKHFSPAFYTEL